jgi:nitroreductase
VYEKDLERILHCACLAPSAGNLQSYRIVIIRSEKDRKAIAEASHKQMFMAEAPILLAFLADKRKNKLKYGKRGSQLFSVQDATIAAAYAQLAATSLGLGTVWIGGFEEEKVAKLLKAKKYEVPVVILPLGYPAEEMEGHERRKICAIATEL